MLNIAHGPEQGAGRTSVSAPLCTKLEGAVHAMGLGQGEPQQGTAGERGPEKPLLRVKGKAKQSSERLWKQLTTPQGSGTSRGGKALLFSMSLP